MKTILTNFPSLSDKQVEQFDALLGLYTEWNEKINVISRKDIQNLYLHHVLHSLAIAKFIHFAPSTHILDVGTGGGFPGIPLAIFFPEVQFVLIDSIGKKIKVVNEVAQAIALDNVEANHCRLQEENRTFDFITSRAVMPFPEFVTLVKKNISPTQKNPLKNGAICLKGGDLERELEPLQSPADVFPLSDYFSDEFFNEKKIVYLPIKQYRNKATKIKK